MPRLAKNLRMRRALVLPVILSLGFLAFGFGGGYVFARQTAPTATPTISPSLTPSPTQTPSATSSPSATPTPTRTPLPSETPTPAGTLTSTPTPTATAELRGRVMEQSNCRYGPGAAYLYEWGLYPGNRVTVLARNQDSSWVYVDPWTYTDYCWVKTDLLQLTGDVASVPQRTTRLPVSDLYRPPKGVSVQRDGDRVIIQWSPVFMTEDDDRGYLIEAWLCKDGQLVFTPLRYTSPPAEVTDEAGCMQASGARLYTAEKHGYTQWVLVPWPTHPGATPVPTP